ncbi:hypothetical protein [Arthrobacter celericrescens]|uniref:hypothetical protein n=1 Tax=Arthrobacter celericrescens TaxID=2320851 RepID=UPI000EA0578F|nr:hypothetical protein [Arthrobacter celericrescens]
MSNAIDSILHLEWDALDIPNTDHPLATSRRYAVPTPQNAEENDKAWNHLYGAMIAGLGLKPDSFQLNYPFLTWDWPITNVGYTSAAQYDFCATAPQFSATGAYVSSGVKFNDAYGQVLNVVAADTSDPVLEQKISQARNVLNIATNDYKITYDQASRAYIQETGGTNDPPFLKWLGSYSGKSWAVQLDAADKTVQAKQRVLNQLLSETSTPGLNDAIARYGTKDYYTLLQDPTLSTFPAVPAYSIGMDATTWLQKVQAGTGGSSGEIGFSNNQAQYDYSKTWAKGSASVGNFFWSVNVGGSWERIDEFATDNSLEVTVKFEAWDTISIGAGLWYNGAFVKSVSEGPFIRGYSAYGGGGEKAVWGPNGIMCVQKVGMVVGYKPSFSVKVSSSAFTSFSKKWEVSSGVRIGPFEFTGGGGSASSGWTADSATSTFSGTSTAETALVLGTTIALVNPE